jgi:PAS domain S-box-containing protein
VAIFVALTGDRRVDVARHLDVLDEEQGDSYERICMAKQQREEQDRSRRAASGVYPAIASQRLQRLHRDVKAGHGRVDLSRDAIRRQRTTNGDRDAAWLAMQEVDVAHEELRIAHEELHAQSDEIAATRQALDAERRRYAELFDKAPDAYVVTDEHGAVLEANHRAGTLFNIDPLFFAGKPLTSFVAAEDRGELRDLITLMDAARIEAQFRIKPRKGAERWVSAAGQGTHCGTREARVIRWLLRDIHDEKVASVRRTAVEQQLRDSVQKLEASKQLFNELCEVAQGARDAAQNVHAARNHLLGEVAQAMRTPLGGIAGWLHVLSKEHHGDITRRALTSITRSVRALATLVEDLVDDTRYDERGIQLERRPVNLLRLAIDVVEELRPLAALKQIGLRFAAQPCRVEILADSLRLQQVFRNLINNAIKFTRPGGTVRIDVRIAHTTAELTVTDTGSGIARDSLRDIFERTVQLDEVGCHDRLGLGLSIARRIAELHGGTITAGSAGLGNGSSFRVTLPLTTFN